MAYSLTILIAIGALLWLVVRLLAIFSDVGEGRDTSERYRIVTDGIFRAAAISLTCTLVALVIAVSVSVVATRKHRRQAVAKNMEKGTGGR